LLPTLQAFVSQCESRGARPVIFFPPVSTQLFEALRPELEAYVARQKALFGDRVLGRLEEISFPEQEFFVTCYHLTGAGSARRTHQIVDRLRSAGFFPPKSQAKAPPLATTTVAPRD